MLLKPFPETRMGWELKGWKHILLLLQLIRDYHLPGGNPEFRPNAWWTRLGDYIQYPFQEYESSHALTTLFIVFVH